VPSSADPGSADPGSATRQATPSQVGCYPDLAGKVVLVTGGTGGLGAPLCRALASQGAHVAVAGRQRAAVLALAAELGRPALAITADCTMPDQVQAMRDELTAALGPPDGVVCLAGGAIISAASGRPGTPHQQPVTPHQRPVTLHQWDTVLANNLTATFLTVTAMVPLMRERGRGTVVTVASAAARIPSAASSPPYAAAKAGVIALTRQLAREVAPDGVRANCVSPSVIVTATNAPAGERLDQLLRQHPLGRLGTPADVTAAVLFLLSAASSWITGVTLDVAGGRTADLPIEPEPGQKRKHDEPSPYRIERPSRGGHASRAGRLRGNTRPYRRSRCHQRVHGERRTAQASAVLL